LIGQTISRRRITSEKMTNLDVPTLKEANAEYALRQRCRWQSSTSLAVHRLVAQTGSSMKACRRLWSDHEQTGSYSGPEVGLEDIIS
jgi:hypothetical protein